MRYNHIFVNTLFPSDSTRQRVRESIIQLRKRGRKSIPGTVATSIRSARSHVVRTSSARVNQTVKDFVTKLIDKLQAAASKGMLIIVEDMQWVDQQSLQILRELASQEFDAVTFVFTSRPPAEIQGETSVTLKHLLDEMEKNKNHLTINIGKILNLCLPRVLK